ncbi:MAG: FMN-binding negative transcriptional regulator [Xanthomonadales bacterium]|jgi:predicted FMN-binding regulatory protein PaiB|nr:FMN-binding negative transcriptional regulator [Xanthomonadales bacterium]
MEAFRFATVISRSDEDVTVTQLPLILDRSRGKYGHLIGHMDRNNPHSRYLEGNRVFAVFHGPNAYISPNVYESTQLPTWNSVSVHVRGTAAIISSLEIIKASLIRMTSTLEAKSAAPYSLLPDDPAMARLLEHIVGFEISIEEVVGRFKLSQDKVARDLNLAMDHLLRQNVGEHSDLIRSLA